MTAYSLLLSIPPIDEIADKPHAPWPSKLAKTDALWEKAQRGFEVALGRAEAEYLRESLRFLTSDAFVAFENVLSR